MNLECMHVSKCMKCEKVIDEPKELIRIEKRDDENGEQLA